MCLVTCHNVILASPLPTAWVTGSIQTSAPFLPIPSLPTIPNTSGPNFNSRPCSYVYMTNPGAFIFKCSCNFQHVCIKSAGVLKIPAAGSVVPERQGFQTWKYFFFSRFSCYCVIWPRTSVWISALGFCALLRLSRRRPTKANVRCSLLPGIHRSAQTWTTSLIFREMCVFCSEKPLKKGELSFAANCRHEKIMCTWQLKVPY